MLPVIIPPLKEESLVSYLHRLTKRNHHKFITQCFPCARLTQYNLSANVFSDEQLREVERVVQNVACDVMTNNQFRDIPVLLVKRSVRYCPLCIKNIPHIKSHWNRRLACMCLDHGVYLLDHCDGCCRRVTRSMLLTGKCSRCHFELCSALPNRVTDPFVVCSQRDLHNFSDSAIHASIGIELPHYEKLLLSSSLVLAGVKSFVSDTDFILQFKKEVLISFDKLAFVIANAHWMYQDFPVNFRIVLDQFSKSCPSQMYVNKATFETELEKPMYKHFWQEYQTYWLNALNQGVITQRNSVFQKNPDLLRQKTVLSGTEAQEFCGIGKRRLAKFVDVHEIDAPRVKRNRLYHRDAVMKVKKSIKHEKKYISYKQAAQHIGVHRAAIAKLVQANILDSNQTETGIRRISKQSVRILLDQCLRQAERGEGLGFYDAVCRYASRGLSISRLIELVRHGNVRVFVGQGFETLRDLMVDEHSLVSAIRGGGNCHKNEYSLQETSDVLGISKEALKSLARTGILVPARKVSHSDGRSWYFYNCATVNNFKALIISTNEAAKILNLAPQSVTRMIRANKLTDVYHGCTRSRWVYRRQVMSLLLHNGK